MARKRTSPKHELTADDVAKGGANRAKKLTPERRKEIAAAGAKARWGEGYVAKRPSKLTESRTAEATL